MQWCGCPAPPAATRMCNAGPGGSGRGTHKGRGFRRGSISRVNIAFFGSGAELRTPPPPQKKGKRLCHSGHSFQRGPSSDEASGFCVAQSRALRPRSWWWGVARVPQATSRAPPGPCIPRLPVCLCLPPPPPKRGPTRRHSAADPRRNRPLRDSAALAAAARVPESCPAIPWPLAPARTPRSRRKTARQRSGGPSGDVSQEQRSPRPSSLAMSRGAERRVRRRGGRHRTVRGARKGPALDPKPPKTARRPLLSDAAAGPQLAAGCATQRPGPSLPPALKTRDARSPQALTRAPSLTLAAPLCPPGGPGAAPPALAPGPSPADGRAPPAGHPSPGADPAGSGGRALGPGPG